MIRITWCVLSLGLFLFSCETEHEDQSIKKPNILWISAEDLSPRFAAYGDSTIATPNIDRLAKEGIVYNHAYTSAGVCSPARNAIITGRYQTSNGGHNMRNLGNTYPEKTGLPKSYNSVPPANVKCFPEYLRAAGYYTSNNVKTDYQFLAPPTVWDEVSRKATWKNREKGQPFFSIFNFTTTHESQIWNRADHKMRVDPATVPLPPYYPDNEITRTDVARHYSNISEMDDQIGELLAQLEEDDLLDNTIIFFWGDHGDGLPFYKREVYRRGLHIPLIVKYPDNWKAGTYDNDFISAIDFGPTVLSIAGIETPEQMDGRAFLGAHKSEDKREFIFGARDRIDSEYDRVRSVMDSDLQYIRNYFPEKPLYMDVAYRKSIPTMRLLLELKEKGQLTEAQSFWFKSTKPAEELYNWQQDPFQLNNLAGDPAYADDLKRLSETMDQWVTDTKDLGGIQEKDLLNRMWNGGDQAPKTAIPVSNHLEGINKLTSITEGASIAYRKTGQERWDVYVKPSALESGDYEALAMRIGYEPSDTLRFSIE